MNKKLVYQVSNNKKVKIHWCGLSGGVAAYAATPPD
jgi:hypothetical protein